VKFIPYHFHVHFLKVIHDVVGEGHTQTYKILNNLAN
jgi:hypothetical protein